ncbi:hypothetical protein PRNP1_013526 [Phytophthora ramorum]
MARYAFHIGAARSPQNDGGHPAQARGVEAQTAAQAIAATTASGQASRIHGKNRKFGSRKEATAAKIAAAKAKREAKEDEAK